MDITILFILLTIGVGSTEKTEGKMKIPMLRGINRSGSEYSCIKGTGIFDGPSDDKIVEKMKKWKINAVRVPMNEDCWLDKNVSKKEYAGEEYKKAIEDWVRLLRGQGLFVILELHWSEGKYEGPSQGEFVDEAAVCQKPMPSKESPKFWEEVAEKFKDDQGILFDLFNEPFPDRAIPDLKLAWKCWKNGGDDCKSLGYTATGMQDLVKAVRKTGAKNMILLGGLDYSNNLEGWADNLPDDPEKNLAASMHSYNFNACVDEACWERGIGKIIKTHPVIVGEIGENSCSHEYIDKMLPYLEKKGISYLGWTWNNWDCKGGPSLIKDEDGEPSDFGAAFKDFLEKNSN